MNREFPVGSTLEYNRQAYTIAEVVKAYDCSDGDPYLVEQWLRLEKDGFMEMWVVYLDRARAWNSHYWTLFDVCLHAVNWDLGHLVFNNNGEDVTCQEYVEEVRNKMFGKAQ